ncbi:MAG: hypothetical protein H6Q55_61 [Deltaproteobacteria bacterium]|jgi:hypothetical protein|nr:hypothetical protein [Deltaproteobacteria bacterium]
MKRKTVTRTGVLSGRFLVTCITFMACMAGITFMASVVPVCAQLPIPHTVIPFQCYDGCFQNDPGNFRGMWWGQSLAEVKGMKYVASDPINVGESYYVKQGDTLELNGVKLEYVQYGFWKGLYSSVAYGTKGEKNWYALQQACFDNFSRWYQPDKAQQKYYWTGTHSAMTLEYSEATEAAQLYVYSKTIYERQLAATRKGYRR